VKPKLSTRSKQILSVLVLAGLVIWATVYLACQMDHLEEFKQALAWSPSALAGLSFLVLVHFTVLGLFSQVILKVFGLDLKHREWFGLAVITTLGNYLLPFRGGAGLRAAYLKKKYSFPLTHFLSTFLAIYLLTIITNSIAGIASLAILNTLVLQIRWPLMLFFGGMLCVSLGGALVPLKSGWLKRLPLPYLSPLMEAWQSIRAHRRVSRNLFFLTILNNLSLTFMIYLGYREMGIDLGLAQGFLLGALFGLGGFVSITPAGLGIQEAVVVFSARTIGIDPVHALALAVVLRVVTVFWTFLLGPLFSYLLLKKSVPTTAENR